MNYEIHPQARIGHVHLTVGDLDRAVRFYRDMLGFLVTARFGKSAAFLSSGDYHHHIGLNTWAGPNVTPPPEGHSGLYHFAILYPNRHELAKAFKILWEAKYPIDGASDHGVSESIYINDPDGNGIELYCDRPREEWPTDQDGNLILLTKPLNLPDLLSELNIQG
ncbi:catechol-2,3-dioxygenase [bacterium BMS3Abin03]|nr:catechol-2,3-dioxygenase [bacterium BMS3Abin03]